MTSTPLQPRLLSDRDHVLDARCIELTTPNVARRCLAPFAQSGAYGSAVVFDAAERACPAPVGATIAMTLMRAPDVMRRPRRTSFAVVTADRRRRAGAVTREKHRVVAFSEHLGVIRGEGRSTPRLSVPQRDIAIGERG